MKKTAVFLPTLETKYVNPKLMEKIEQLDLTLIRDRMIIKHGWTEEDTDAAIEKYRKFLYMTQMFEQSLSPTPEIDEIWHEHILHTNKYAIDCKKTFGTFLHHFPTPAKWAQKKLCGLCDGGGDDCSAKCDTQKTANADCVDGGGCEGSCQNDSCDSGTTNCQRRKKSLKINYDNPVLEGRSEAINFNVIEQKFFS